MIDRSFHQHIQQIQQWMMMTMTMTMTMMCSSVSIVGIILVLSQTPLTMHPLPQSLKHSFASLKALPAVPLVFYLWLSSATDPSSMWPKIAPAIQPGGITIRSNPGPAAWLCPHTWQIAWCQSSPENAGSRFTGRAITVYQIITITASHNLLMDTDLSENRLPHSIHYWLIIRFHIV